MYISFKHQMMQIKFMKFTQATGKTIIKTTTTTTQ
jgi:hypothetical protein